jgi:hypothetical protein
VIACNQCETAKRKMRGKGNYSIAFCRAIMALKIRLEFDNLCNENEFEGKKKVYEEDKKKRFFFLTGMGVWRGVEGELVIEY